MTNFKTKLTAVRIVLLGGVCAASMNCSSADQPPNSFFGTMPGTTGLDQTSDHPRGTNSPDTPQLPAADVHRTFVQVCSPHRYRDRMRYAQDLIAKGEQMMKNGISDSMEYKKGKILKEIGGRELAELKNAGPLPAQPEKSKCPKSD